MTNYNAIKPQANALNDAAHHLRLAIEALNAGIHGNDAISREDYVKHSEQRDALRAIREQISADFNRLVDGVPVEVLREWHAEVRR